jgi:hypothetical protein
LWLYYFPKVLILKELALDFGAGGLVGSSDLILTKREN